MALGVCPEHVGRLNQLLEAEILEDGLGNEQVQLRVEAALLVELHEHVTTALTIGALEEVLPGLGILPHLPQPVCDVLMQPRVTHGGATAGPLEAGGQIVRLVNVITGDQLVQPEKRLIRSHSRSKYCFRSRTLIF